MARLKFDRLLALSLSSGETFTVPKGEFWKGACYGLIGTNFGLRISLPNGSVEVKGSKFEFIEDTVLKGNGTGKVALQGIAFKVVNE